MLISISSWFFHTIFKDFKYRIRVYVLKLQRNGDADINYPTAPPIPEYNAPPNKHQRLNHLPFVPKDYERYTDTDLYKYFHRF
jgi:hypothetical protein